MEKTEKRGTVSRGKKAPFKREKVYVDAVDKYLDTRQERFLSALSPNLNVMITAVQKAGRGLMRDFGEIERLQISKKGAADFVSSADMNSERTLRTFLKEARPRYGFLQEESGAVAGADTSHRWIIDPLDGTTNFLHGVGHFAISLALQEDNGIIAGVIYNPVTSEMYYAEKGNGAWASVYGRTFRLRVSERSSLDKAVLATGIPHLGHSHPASFIRQLTPVMEKTAGVRRMGAASLDMAYVAAGKFEGFWEEDLKPWDVAAGILLVKEAGGHICTLDGDETVKAVLEARSVLATNDSLYVPLQRMLKNKAEKQTEQQ